MLRLEVPLSQIHPAATFARQSYPTQLPSSTGAEKLDKVSAAVLDPHRCPVVGWDLVWSPLKLLCIRCAAKTADQRRDWMPDGSVPDHSRPLC